ncbi:MAG: DUF3048 domain-containing protein [Patescibacteria group bacterium]|jgi:hypothetical protein
MQSRLKYIKGRFKQTIPELRGAFVGVARKASWSRVLPVLAIVAIMTVGVSALVIRRSFTAKIAPVPVIAESADAFPRDPLTGLVIPAPLTTLPQVFAVMIENSYEAWPLSGLDQAFFVIEAPVEGNIPRFITFFEEGAVSKKIGPVRSARPYYLDWADEFESIYAHVGGSPEALDLIHKNGTTRDFDQFFQSEYFWRDNVGRFAPHNVYTSMDLLMSSLDEIGRSTKAYTSWLFVDGEASGKEISPVIDWESGSTYDVTWEYDKATNLYIRYQGKQMMKTSSGANITANNVIVFASDISVVDSTGRRHIRTTGEGESLALVYQNGEQGLEARWVKHERTDRLRFIDLGGSEIAMNAGKTWMEVVPDLKNVSESQPKAPAVDVTNQQ